MTYRKKKLKSWNKYLKEKIHDMYLQYHDATQSKPLVSEVR